MKYEIKPFLSIGLIKLGMSSSDIHQILGSEDVMKNENEFAEIEVWIKKGIRVVYESGICNAIECIPPAEAVYNRENLFFKMKCKEIFALLRPFNDKVYSDEERILFLNSGIEFYFGEIHPEALPSIISIFPKNSQEEHLFLYN